jgi:4-alpha-glucanotransferase
MYKLFLDDLREPNVIYRDNNWVIVRDMDSFKNIIHKNGVPILISYDHDLGVKESGLDVLKWMCYYCIDNNIKLPSMLFHSSNPVGKENMIKFYEFIKKYNNHLI